MSDSSPNKPALGNAGIAPRLAVQRHWPGVPEPERRRMRTTFTVSPAYRAAIIVSLPQQVATILLTVLMLDGGVLRQVCGMAFLAFWVGVGLIMLRGPLSPSRVDLFLIRFGFVPLFVAACFLARFIWQIRGVL
jgi:hypothetical protein